MSTGLSPACLRCRLTRKSAVADVRHARYRPTETSFRFSPLEYSFPHSSRQCQDHRRHLQPTVVSGLGEPAKFCPSRLTISDMTERSPGLAVADIGSLLPRVYTVTHDDMTADLFLTISSSVDVKQLGGWSSKLFRDEVVGEWRVRQRSSGDVQYSLHLHCHVSGSHSFLAPPVLRSWIFEREMPLVLESIIYAEKSLLASHPDLTAATVWIHYHSHSPSFDRADCWGPLHSSVSRSRGEATLLDVLGIWLSDFLRWPFDDPGFLRVPSATVPVQACYNPTRELRPQALALTSKRHPEQFVVPLVLTFVYVANCVFLMNVLAATTQ